MKYSRRQTCIAIVADRDTRMVWDGGSFRVRAGDILYLTDDGLIFATDVQQFRQDWQDDLEALDEHDQQRVAELQRALETGHW